MTGLTEDINTPRLAIENERLKSGLYSRVIERGIEYTACRGCSYPEGGFPNSDRHARGCWVEKLLQATRDDLGGELLDIGHEMARRFSSLVCQSHDQARHGQPFDTCYRANCGLHRELLNAWHRLTQYELRAGHAWAERIKRLDQDDERPTR